MFRWLLHSLRRLTPLDRLSETLAASLASVTQRLTQLGVRHALIGGVAVSLHGPPRSTLDLDFLVAAENSDAAHQLMLELGFEALQRTEVFGNYRLGSLRVDFLFTRGPLSRAMLERAQPVSLGQNRVRLVGPEDLVGLKLQALANNPDRKNDWPDIVSLIEGFHATMDLSRLREYFMLFEREHELDTLLQAIRSRTR